jgi:diaminohydroxyphosphoribosylaminopyrimidine deaminase / 5-amino-6-(5-phosphoribosylamino)uracil reductase
MDQRAEDARYMARALYLARKGMYTTDPNPRVGCVLVKGGGVIAEGWHKRAGEAHAEVDALNNLADTPEGATAYVTLEPCSHHGRTPPCCEALVKAGIKRVVAAMQDPNPLVAGRGLDFLKQNGVEVEFGLLEEDARALNQGFIKRMTEGRPFVRSKLAMSLDGRTAMASGESKWITSEASRADVQKLRAQSSAILTGINTVLADDPSLTARLDEEVTQPVRVILDSNLQMPLTAKMLGLSGRTIILTCEPSPFEKPEDKVPPVLRQAQDERNQNLTARPESFNDAQESLIEGRIQQLKSAGAEIFLLPELDGRLDLNEVMKFLAQQQINEILVEAGAILNGGLLQANLVDEWVIYMAPKILGDQGKGLFHMPDLVELAACKNLNIKDIRMFGNNVKLLFEVDQTNIRLKGRK